MVTSEIPTRKEASADSRIAERRQHSLRVLVLGATGGTGRALLEQGRKEGHQITALVAERRHRQVQHRQVHRIEQAGQGDHAKPDPLATPGFGWRRNRVHEGPPGSH